MIWYILLSFCSMLNKVLDVKTIRYSSMGLSLMISMEHVCVKVRSYFCLFAFLFCWCCLSFLSVTDRSKTITILLYYSNKQTVKGLKALAFFILSLPYPPNHRDAFFNSARNGLLQH